MCDAFDITPPDASGTGAVALARLESCVSEETSGAAEFWSALGSRERRRQERNDTDSLHSSGACG